MEADTDDKDQLMEDHSRTGARTAANFVNRRKSNDRFFIPIQKIVVNQSESALHSIKSFLHYIELENNRTTISFCNDNKTEAFYTF